MRRLACVAVHELPLQLLLRDNPEWQGGPVVVVSADRANGLVLYLNEAARARGIAPGMRHGQALSLAHELRAGVVPVARCEQAGDELLQLLMQFSPVVEPKHDEPGVLWLDGGGLGSLYGSASRWGEAIDRALQAAGWQHTVIVGFGRFASYAAAVARTHSPLGVFRSPEHQRAFVQGISLQRLLREPRELERLGQLGIHRLRELLRLPEHSLRERVGPMAYGLRRLAGADMQAPLQAERVHEPLHGEVVLESVAEDCSSILFRLRGLLPPLLARAEHRCGAVVAMELCLRPDHGEPMAVQRIETAAPTLDERVLIDLIRLRLEALQMRVPLRAVQLTLVDRPVRPAQDSLLAARPRRELRAANQALARLRSELGPQAVRTMELREGHLPEASWGWHGLQSLPAISPVPAQPQPPLVRRQQRPERIAAPQAAQLAGPVILGGGWWHQALERHYYLRAGGSDNLQWVYFDARRGLWYRQARVE